MSKKSVIVEYLKAIALAFAIALVIRTFVVQAFRIPSGSMEDTLLIGDFLLANKFIYGARIPFTGIRLPAIREPEPGDVVIFQYPRDPSRDYIKRIVAGPGQNVEIKDKKLYVDGEIVRNPPRAKHTDPFVRKFAHTRDNYGPVRVPEGGYFAMGDNRDRSEDSRYWGFLERDLIRGKAFVLYWSWAPDAHGPKYHNWSSLPGIALYHLLQFPSRTRWRRIGMLVE